MNADQKLKAIEAAWVDCSFADVTAQADAERIEAAQVFMTAVGNVLFGEATSSHPHWMTAIERVSEEMHDEAMADYERDGGDVEDPLAFEAYYERWIDDQRWQRGV